MLFAENPSRTKGVETKDGLILYYSENDQWEVDYPKDEWSGKNKRYGAATTIRVISLIYYLAQGKTIEETDRLAFCVQSQA